MAQIFPSLLSADFSRLGQEIQAVEAAGADGLHLDVMDGHFVPNLTVGPAVVAALRKVTRLPLDVHLMIADPDRFLDAFVEAGADILTVHVEAAIHLHRTVAAVRAAGIRAGVSLNPATPLVLVEPILPEIDLLLVMTVNPGFGGQRFIPSIPPKVHAARALIDRVAPAVQLEVDGGITEETVSLLREARVDVCVAGSFIFGGGEYGQAIQSLRSNSGLLR